jgi:hypothetical protein
MGNINPWHVNNKAEPGGQFRQKEDNMKKLEYENDLLIVDELIFDPTLANGVVVRIESEYYMLNSALAAAPINESALRPYKRTVNKDWAKATYDHQFYTYGMMPRGGFKVAIGRSITAGELEEIFNKYHLGPEDVSAEFADKSGMLYGEKYAKTYTSRQIRVPTDKALSIEHKLRDKGIEAFSGSPGRVNIRTDWGGKREGAGRPATGRKKVNYYVTGEEDSEIKKLIEQLRKPSE